MKPCLLIPIYDHGETIGAVVDSLEYLDLPCLIIDDGSGSDTRHELERIARHYEWVTVERREQNGGRGAALRCGYRLAAELGMTHAIQLDADAQHDARDVPRFLEAAHKNPEALILGEPIFDDSAPAIRVYGRRLSQWLVWLESFSFEIHDPLCGFRCFPLESTLRLIDENPLGDRMEFDPEIIVRMLWAGVPIWNVPTHVQYHAGGLSHFDMLRDNLRIARAHARLVGGGLLKAPQLLSRSGHDKR
jgi:glycosyltransferase involved in cell wall biosynthesis